MICIAECYTVICIFIDLYKKSSHKSTTFKCYIDKREEFVTNAILLFIAIGIFLFAVWLLLLTFNKTKNQLKETTEEINKNLEYRQLIQSENNVVASMRMDLTQNVCTDLTRVCQEFDVPNNIAFNDFVESERDRIYYRDGAHLMQEFSRENLLNLMDEGKSSHSCEFRYRVHDTHYVWLRATAHMLRNPANDNSEALFYMEDVDHKKRLEQISNKLFAYNFELVGLVDVSSGHLSLFADSTQENVSNNQEIFYDDVVRAFYQEMEQGESNIGQKTQFYLKDVLVRLQDRDIFSVICRMPLDDNGEQHYKKMCFAWLDDSREIFLVTREDVTALVASQYDSLTGLYSLDGFQRAVDTWLQENPGVPFQMICYDIDNFKMLNARYGYEEGDLFLQKLGKSFLAEDTENSFSARLTADHFARFCVKDDTTAEESLRKMKNAISEYSSELYLGAYCGVYDLCEKDCTFSDISYKALLALQSAKSKYSEHIEYYTPKMQKDDEEQASLLNDLESSIRNGYFKVYFQPQIDYLTGALVGAEALIRWDHPERGMISPGVFIPVLENRRLITVLDEYVWEKTCEYLVRWRTLRPDASISISINLSRLDLHRPGIVEHLLGLTRFYKIPLEALRLEITESACIEGSDRVGEIVKSLKDTGFIVEMDDFGTGYSSLNTLEDIHLDVLKLDMKFISRLCVEPRAKVVTSNVVKMAQELNMSIIAEGVETEEQASMLQSLGVHYMQGYLFSKPIPAEEFEAKLCSSTFIDMELEADKKLLTKETK